MLKKSVCFKCHMKYYGVDGTDRSVVKCYPPPNEEDKKQCEWCFEQEWKEDKVWCFGLDNNASDDELKELLGEDKWNLPFLNPKTAEASKFCDYQSEHQTKSKPRKEKSGPSKTKVH